MKKYLNILSLFLIVFVSSCNLDDIVTFNINYDTEATIPSILGINIPIEIPIPLISKDFDSELSSNNSKKELIKKAYLKELIIKSKDPIDQELGIIKNIEIFINAEGYEEVKIAEKFDIPKDNGTELVLNIFDEYELAKYIKKDKFNLRVKITARKIVLHKIKIDINTLFSVTANVF